MILYAGGWEWGQSLPSDDPLYRTAVTGFFASIIICQIADVIICRTRRQSLLTVGLFSNRLVWIGIGTELLLLALIAYVPAFNVFFGHGTAGGVAAGPEHALRAPDSVRRRTAPCVGSHRKSLRHHVA